MLQKPGWTVTALVLAATVSVAAQPREPGTRYAIAIERADLDLIQELIDEGHGPDTTITYGSNTTTPLVKAAGDGHVDVVRLLIDAGADLDGTTSNGQTALIAAVSSGWDDVVGVLIEAGADVNLVDGFNGTALTTAVGGGHEDLVDLLVDAGADLSYGMYGITPLMLASQTGDTDMIRKLVEKGADVNALSEGEYGGLHPVSSAITMKRAESLKVLIELGADVNLKSRAGTPLEEARAAGADEMVAILEAAGAR